MAEEFDPERFSLRVSQNLFQVLAGRAADPGAIEPRTHRESSLIEAVRREGYQERVQMLQKIKEQQLKETYEKEQTARSVVMETSKALKEKLTSLNFPSGSVSDSEQPCAKYRDAVTHCYRVNGKENPLACTGSVEAFAECAKQLSKVINSQ